MKTETKDKKQTVDIQKSSDEPREDWSGGRPDLKLKREKLGATGNIVFGEIPMPDIPDVPNLIVGMVTDSNKKLWRGRL